ncbi:MAG: hypothetical protein FJX77_05515 [Armatimonadetes bacterium]|nr:hypothetical protein [Armatimonadota bacterium]
MGTLESRRKVGYSRYVLERTVQHMTAGESDVSMLYGIRDYYPKFGYATTGPEHQLHLSHPSLDAPLPPGWTARPYRCEDLPAVRAVYERALAGTCGTAVRAENERIWSRLDRAAASEPVDTCRVVVGPDGLVHGYAWHCPDHWAVRGMQRSEPQALVLGEVMADGPEAADAILAVCRRWGAEQAGAGSDPVTEVLTSLTEEGPVAAAAQLQDARFTRRFTGCGGSMTRVLNVERLFRALLPELDARLEAAGWPFQGLLHFQTDIGGAWVALDRTGSRVYPAAPAKVEDLSVELPQTALARLALGSFRPEDILVRLSPTPRAARLLCTLFPQRQQNMLLPDRY